MNFIYSILLFLTISLISFGVTSHVQPVGAWHDLYVGITVITGLVSVIFIICMVFRQMEFVREFRVLINRIRANKDNITLKSKDLERYKTELQEALTKLYPEYEKELFKGMNQSDSENLSAIMVKYPELKFNGILTEYTNGIKKRLASIAEYEEAIIFNKRDLEDINMNGWKFGTSPIPSDC